MNLNFSILLAALALADLTCAPGVYAQPAAAVTTIFSFDSGADNLDGIYPTAGVIQGKDGNLYGTVEEGGKTMTMAEGRLSSSRRPVR